MLFPQRATRRPQRAAALIASWIRWRFEENMATTTLPAACPKISPRASPTNFSGGLTPSRSTFVESEKSAVTPSAAEIARSRSTPVGTPSSGYGSIRSDELFRRAHSFPLHVRGVGEERGDPFGGGDRPEPFHSGRHAVERIRVDLEIPGVDEDSIGTAQHVSHGVGDAVADGKRLHVEVSEAEAGVPRDRKQARGPLEPLLGEAVAQEAQRQAGAVDGDVEFAEEERDGADVVLVSVGEQEGAEVGRRFTQNGKVRKDVVDPQHRVVGEQEAGVDQQRRSAVVEQHGVEADLAQPAQRDHTKRHRSPFVLEGMSPSIDVEQARAARIRSLTATAIRSFDPPAPSPGESGGSTRTRSSAGRTRRPPFGIARYPPSRET